MSSRIGRALSVQLFGESHGPLVGVTLDGLPAGLLLNQEELQAFLRRRAAKGGELTTGRQERDEPRIVSGLFQGVTTGQPLTALFDHGDAQSGEYAFLPDLPRPGHADYPALVRSGGHDDLRGGGHHSGRLTLPYAFAGGVAKQLLRTQGVEVFAHLWAIGETRDRPLSPCEPDTAALAAAQARDMPTLSQEAGEAMKRAVLAAKAAGDSLGGVVECVALGLSKGLGSPFFEGLEALAAAHFFSIPAVKGVEFGDGFSAAELLGSQYNDAYALREGRIVTDTNHAGGILGGLTTGMPLIARVAFRPTPSIGLAQKTVSLSRQEEETLRLTGRHDPCVAIRAVAVVEGALCLALCDAWLQRQGNGPISGGQA